MARPLNLVGRRVRQTLADFDNGPSLLARLAWQRVSGRGADLEFRVDDRLVVVCPNVPGARVPVYEVFAEDAYRLSWFTGDLGPDVSAIDIGGHIGCFSMAFARLHPKARVQTFEASPATAVYTRRNIESNGFADRVTVNNLAISSHHGVLEFADNAGGSGLNGLTAPAEGHTVIEVECVTFAEAMERAGGSAEVVKIDTEGAEYDIVLASSPSDWEPVQRVVLEYHDVPGHSSAELVGFFDAAGLGVVRSEPVTDRLGTLWLSRG